MTKKFLIVIALFITVSSFADENTEYLINIEANTHQTWQALNGIDQELLDFSNIFSSQYNYNSNDSFLINPSGLMYLQNADLPTSGSIRDFLSYGLSRYDVLLSSLNNYDGHILKYFQTNQIPFYLTRLYNDFADYFGIYTNNFAKYFFTPNTTVSQANVPYASYQYQQYTKYGAITSSMPASQLKYNLQGLTTYLLRDLPKQLSSLNNYWYFYDRFIHTNVAPNVLAISSGIGNVTNSLNNLLSLTNNLALSEITATNTTKLVDYTSHVDDFLSIYTNDFFRSFLDIHPNGEIPFSLYTSPYVDMIASGQYVPKQDVYNYDTLTDYLYVNNKSLITRLSSLNNYWAYFTEFYRTNNLSSVLQITNALAYLEALTNFVYQPLFGAPSHDYEYDFGDFYGNFKDDDGKFHIFERPSLHISTKSIFEYFRNIFHGILQSTLSLNNYAYNDYYHDIATTNLLALIYDKISSNDLFTVSITNVVSFTNDFSTLEDILVNQISNKIDEVLAACTNHFNLFDATFHDSGNPFIGYQSTYGDPYDYLTNLYFKPLHGSSASDTHTNWVSRIEILLAALVFHDSIETNMTNSSQASSQSSQIGQSFSDSISSSQVSDGITNLGEIKKGIIDSFSSFSQIVQVSSLPTRISFFDIQSPTENGDDVFIGVEQISEDENKFFDFVRNVTTFAWCITGLFVLYKVVVWSIGNISLCIRFIYSVFSH